MAEYQRLPNRFICSGLTLNAPRDLDKPGGFPILTNMRSYEEGAICVRPGTNLLATLPGPVHSLARLNDPTPFNPGTPYVGMAGVGTDLYFAPAGLPPVLIDTGYSGFPLTAVAVSPVDSNRPFLYVVDSARMRKYLVDGTGYEIGIAAPTFEPTAFLQPLGINIIEEFSPPFIPWVVVGTGASGVAFVTRVSTTISAIIYDQGVSGYASVVPTVYAGIGNGMLIRFNGAESAPVTSATIPIAATTIASIVYDNRTGPGLCTIQPAGSLGVGQINQPVGLFQANGSPVASNVASGYRVAIPRGANPATYIVPGTVTAPTAPINQVDFPVNCIINLGNTELARIISVQEGRDGVQSFRCLTTSVHGINESLSGAAAFRVSLSGTYEIGQSLTDSGLSFLVSPTAPDPPLDPQPPATATAGLRGYFGGTNKNLALINGRATLPDDDLHLSIRATFAVELDTVRVYLSVESNIGATPQPTDFTEDYYFFEWRQNDISDAIQASNATPTATIQDVRATVAANVQLNPPNLRRRQAAPESAVSQQLALGNDQWIELHCKIKDLVRIGTDPSKSLANVRAAEVIVSVIGPSPITVSIDALWISGGYPPDVVAGPSYTWAYRYRSSSTGIKSNPSPTLRAGLRPQRQSNLVVGVQSPDPQVDLVDWFRFGGAIPGSAPMYAGTTLNSETPPHFLDVYSDAEVSGSGELLDFDRIQPWPTVGPDTNSTVNVAGTAVQWIAGDLFDPRWIPGTQIFLNGQPYTLYAQPPSTDFLEIVESAGALLTTPMKVGAPTILGAKQRTFWGPFQGFYFSIDPVTGALTWTNGNDPDSTSQANNLYITNASEPLINGFIWDGLPYVWSSQNLYRIEAAGGASAFIAFLTPCGRGLWGTWAFCVTPEGVVFLAEDGLRITAAGSPSVSISDADLYALFPHDGIPGIESHGYLPPDMTQAHRMRLCYVDGYVYFDYATAA